MPEQVKLTSSEDDLLHQVCGFASRHAVNGVYLAQLYDKGLSAPVLLIVALGDQAMALQEIMMKVAVRDEGEIIQRAGNGGF